MGTLQFIDAMTGRLAWPVVALLLGLIFRHPVSLLIGRVRHLSWGDAEAEHQKARIERAVQGAVNLGFTSGRKTDRTAAPDIQIKWEKGVPHLLLSPSSAEEHLIGRVLARLKRTETNHAEAE